jgi:hypothetical protein
MNVSIAAIPSRVNVGTSRPLFQVSWSKMETCPVGTSGIGRTTRPLSILAVAVTFGSAWRYSE